MLFLFVGPACSLELPAASTERCPAGPDPLTVGLWRFEEETGSFESAAGEHPATMIGKEGADWNRGSGPDGCGRALALTPDDGGTATYAKVAHHPAWDLQRGSVELWVRFADTLPKRDVEGVLSRDANLHGRPGHFLVFRACDGRLVVRLQRADESFYVCSDPLSDHSWHHLGINFGGGPLQLYVDGRQADNTEPVSCRSPPGTLLCGSGERTTGGIDGNENPWVIGAVSWSSEEGSPEPTTDHSLVGAIDQLLIRRDRWEFEQR